MTTKEEKLEKLLEKVQDLCLSDENFFATGWEADGRHKWVAWIILRPGCRPMVFDSGLPNGGGFELDQLAEPRIDRLLQLDWRCPKPVSTLDKFARAASGDPIDSGLRRQVALGDVSDDVKMDIVKMMSKEHLSKMLGPDKQWWLDDMLVPSYGNGGDAKHD
jgi:hypothetical protein